MIPAMFLQSFVFFTMLFEPYTFITPLGFEFERGGYYYPVVKLDAVYQDAAKDIAISPHYEFLRDAFPYIVRVRFESAYYWQRNTGCMAIARVAVIRNDQGAKNIIIVNGAMDAGEIDNALREGFRLMFWLLQYGRSVAQFGGCAW